MTTYHPTGTIRVLTPAEQTTMERRARAAVTASAHTGRNARRSMQETVARVRGTLREFARQCVEIQAHRAGF